MTKINKTYTIYRGDNRSFKEINIKVPESTKEILIKGNYFPVKQKDKKKNWQLITPALKKYYKNKIKQKVILKEAVKRLSPVRNLVRYALFDPEGYLRIQAIEFFRTMQLNEEYVTPGCYQGKIPPGEWKLILELHAVVTERVTVEMEIELNEKISPPVKSAEKLKKEKKELNKLDINRKEKKLKNWYCGDLHVHSFHSDGNNSLAELIQDFHEKDIDFFVLSDHNTTSGWRKELLEYMLVIPGCEVTSFYGHFVGINQKDYIDWYDLDKKSNIEKIINIINKDDGLFSLAHYGSIGNPVCTGCRWEYENLNWQLVDCMEIALDPDGNKKIESETALEVWEEQLNKGRKIVAVSGRDIHTLSNDEKSRIPLTYVKAEDLSRENILKGIKKGRVYLACSLDIDFKIENKACHRKYGPGEKVKLKRKIDNQLFINFKIKGLTAHSEIEIIKNGKLLKKFKTGKWMIERSFILEKFEENGWVNLRIKGKAGNLLGLTNPVFIGV
ncbi:MAG: CehA/McbA family metallohydrolase [Nanoarchaeota archaeon]